MAKTEHGAGVYKIKLWGKDVTDRVRSLHVTKGGEGRRGRAIIHVMLPNGQHMTFNRGAEIWMEDELIFLDNVQG